MNDMLFQVKGCKAANHTLTGANMTAFALIIAFFSAFKDVFNPLNDAIKRLDRTFIALNGMFKQLNGTFIALNVAFKQLDVTFIHLNGTDKQLNAVFIALNDISIHLNDANIAVNDASLSMNRAFNDRNVKKINGFDEILYGNSTFLTENVELCEKDNATIVHNNTVSTN
jgi:hypothetical protein